MKTHTQPPAAEIVRAFERADYVLLLGLMLPLMMTIVNITMFEVGIPTVRDAFGIQADVAAWMVTAYSLPFMLFMPLYGRLGDELGKRRLFLIGITVFLGGSILIPCATDLRVLLLGRVIQGIGAAGISPLCMALITQHFPTGMRGKALGTWNSIGPISGIAGPFLAGFIIDSVGWRAMYAPIMLIGLISFATIHRQIPATHITASHNDILRRFDWSGVILLNIAITFLMFYISSRPITGVDALQDWRLLAFAVLGLVGFIFWERRRQQPFVRLEIFRNTSFCLASVASGIRMTVMGNLGFLIPLYLTDIHALNATSIGLISTLNAAALLLTLRFGGLLADRWDNRWPVMIGAIVQMAVAVYFACLRSTAPIWWVGAGLTIHGLGSGLALAPLHRTSLSKIQPAQVGMAAGLYSMIRFGISALGVAVAGVLLQYSLDRIPAPITPQSAVKAYQFVFWCVAAFASSGIVLAWNLRE